MSFSIGRILLAAFTRSEGPVFFLFCSVFSASSTTDCLMAPRISSSAALRAASNSGPLFFPVCCCAYNAGAVETTPSTSSNISYTTSRLPKCPVCVFCIATGIKSPSLRKYSLNLRAAISSLVKASTDTLAPSSSNFTPSI